MSSNSVLLPGMEEFVEKPSEEEDFFFEGKPSSKYFDSTTLPDAPGYVRNAEANQTYILHIVIPSYEELVRAIRALTGGERKGIAATAKEGTINGIAIRKGEDINWLQYWEQRLLNIQPVIEEDTEPELIPGEAYPEEKPKKEKKKVLAKQKIEKPVAAKPSKKPKEEKKPVAKKKEIPVISKYGSSLSISSDDVMIAFPTYKRSNDVKTWKYFPEGLAIGFVEPQELHLYSNIHDEQSILMYTENGLTINQKRNTIVQYAIDEGKRWLFMLEDDLTGFFKRDGKTAGGSHKLVRCEYKEAMNHMLNFADTNKIAELGLSQQQSNHFYEEPLVAWSCKVTEFCLLDLNVLRETGINYDVAMPHFEDFEISIQLLMAGKKVGLFTPYAFGHVTMATNKSGGFISEGMEKRKKLAEEAIAMMEVKYPGIVSKKDGRLFPEPKINWTTLHNMIEL